MKTKLLLISLLSVFVTALVAPVVRAVPATGPWYQPKPGDQNPLVMAHQGGEGEYPSNTMLAFTKAHQAGADVLDTDMFATSDGELVLFHDETLEHRTNCTGPIANKNFQQLSQCDAAYWWTPDGGATYPHRGTGLKIPKFQELLTAFPSSRIGIEIKQTTLQAATTLCNVITANNAQGRVLVSSSTQPNMNQFRAVCPTVATSATFDEVVEFINSTGPYDILFSSLQVPMALVNTSFVTKAHQNSLKVYAWTIDTPAQTQPLIDAGVDGVNTSYPKRINDWLVTPLKSCGTLGITYKLTTPPTSHLCVWVIQSWMNEARDKYNQENNPAWPSVATDGVYNIATKDLVIVWQYISNSQPGGLPVTGEANPATLNHMSLACVAAEATYAYNSSLC
ncbi:MAG TPA: glycerophosphodiester phosphodiesterase [Candidatus Limnocylindria bacterium]|nr:glycerophosphodiester phosphodiesterase [Candidatus Limnocylindria bacterium]